MTPGSAPSVTREQIDAAIAGETYTVLPDGRTTICQLTLYNGFSVIGKSACVSAANFDAEMGRQIARTNAVNELWQLLGFRLAEELYRVGLAMPAVPEPASVEPMGEIPSLPYPQIVLGDQVLFYERSADKISPPLVALVTEVISNRYVSLAVFAPNGTAHARQQVLLLGPDDAHPTEALFFARRKENAA